MQPTQRTARIAGWMYVAMGLFAPFSLIYVPRTLIVQGNAAATADNVLGHEMLFRAGVLGTLFSAVGLVLLALVLRRLLRDVNETLAALMVILVAISVAISFLNEVNNLAALTLFRGADFLAVLDEPQRDALGMLFLGLHRRGITVNEIFWGLWLFPFGVLVTRSGFLPRILGLLLIVNGLAYVATSITSLLWPSYAQAVAGAMMPALLGELWIMLWLLIKGVSGKPSAAAAA